VVRRSCIGNDSSAAGEIGEVRVVLWNVRGAPSQSKSPFWFCAWRRETISVSEKAMRALHDEPPFLTYMRKPVLTSFSIPIRDPLIVIFTLKSFVDSSRISPKKEHPSRGGSLGRIGIVTFSLGR
jgi:hypothetical protein